VLDVFIMLYYSQPHCHLERSLSGVKDLLMAYYNQLGCS
jgi:hypothetical protein